VTAGGGVAAGEASGGTTGGEASGGTTAGVAAGAGTTAGGVGGGTTAGVAGSGPIAGEAGAGAAPGRLLGGVGATGASGACGTVPGVDGLNVGGGGAGTGLTVCAWAGPTAKAAIVAASETAANSAAGRSNPVACMPVSLEFPLVAERPSLPASNRESVPGNPDNPLMRAKVSASAARRPFPDLRFRLLVIDCCVIPMHEREQEQHPGADQYRGHCRGINARQ
jgi:hypothetical protein